MLAAIFFFFLVVFILLSKKINAPSKKIVYLNSFQSIEEQNNILLPKLYKDFVEICAYSKPSNLVGTDLGIEPSINLNDLQLGATELLEEDGIDNFLQGNDFVFMMHQGYQFWYFKADGNPDPIVYYYYEGKLKSENKGPFSEFVKDFS